MKQIQQRIQRINHSTAKYQKHRDRFYYIYLLITDFLSASYTFLFSPIKKKAFTARFANKLEEWNILRSSNTGFVIDGIRAISKKDAFKNCIVYGLTGSEKTQTCFIPSILNLDTSAVILDCSGELYEQTSGHLYGQGFTIKRFNLTDISCSETYNPLLRIDENDTGKMNELASTLVETSLGSTGGDNKFWVNSATSVLYTLIRALIEKGDRKYCTLYNVLHMVNNLSSSKKSLTYLWMMKNAQGACFTEFRGHLSGNPKTVDSILATIRGSLEKIANTSVASITGSDSFGDFGKMRREPTALYITVNELMIPYFSFVLSLLVTDLFSMVLKTPKKDDLPIFFLLDEFTQMKIPNFATISTVIRKRKSGLLLCAQAKSQFYKQYGKNDGVTITTGGTATHVYLQNNNFAEIEELSKSLGKRSVRVNGKDITKPLMGADEIFRMEGKGIVMQTGKRPILIHPVPAYRNKKLTPLTQKPPAPYPETEKPLPPTIDFSQYNQPALPT
ncbi:MAG: type IV secretory system conjugative DNA transfer family protein [Bacteroidota bacterium]